MDLYVDTGGAVARSTGAGGYYNYPSRVGIGLSGFSLQPAARRTGTLGSVRLDVETGTVRCCRLYLIKNAPQVGL